jgi:putative ABC transport system permease protein
VDIRGHFFRVVGVFKERPAAEGAERDVYVPLGTSRRRFGDVVRDKNTKENQKVEFHEIVVRLKKPDDIAEVEKALRELLEKNHARKDWEITKR